MTYHFSVFFPQLKRWYWYKSISSVRCENAAQGVILQFIYSHNFIANILSLVHFPSQSKLSTNQSRVGCDIDQCLSSVTTSLLITSRLIGTEMIHHTSDWLEVKRLTSFQNSRQALLASSGLFDHKESGTRILMVNLLFYRAQLMEVSGCVLSQTKKIHSNTSNHNMHYFIRI